MKEWFTGVVRGKITSATGKGKKVRETYLVDAMGFHLTKKRRLYL